MEAMKHNIVILGANGYIGRALLEAWLKDNNSKDYYYYAVDMLRGIIKLSLDFKEISILPVEKNSEPHGICIDVEKNNLFVGSPGRDSVIQYSASKL